MAHNGYDGSSHARVDRYSSPSVSYCSLRESMGSRSLADRLMEEEGEKPVPM